AKEARKAAKDAVDRDIESLADSASSGDKEKIQIVSDGLQVVSLSFRLDLESIALIPIMIVQSAKAPPSPSDLAKSASFGTAMQPRSLVDNLGTIKDQLSEQIPYLEAMTESLAKAKGSSLDDTAGFILHETIVDQVAGITFDSFRANLRAGGELF